jgi:putative membrane protein
MELSEQDKSGIREAAARIEERTGVQVVAVVTDKSDAYPEIPWKAFSLGASLAALAVTAAAAKSGWNPVTPLLSATAVLGAGMVLALAGIFLRPVARLFLGNERAEAETRQFAQSLFLELGLCRTRSRNAILVLASRFERRAAVVADTGITDRVSESDLGNIRAAMDVPLACSGVSAALGGALSALEQLLLQRGFAAAPAAGDEIPAELLETEGPKP